MAVVGLANQEMLMLLKRSATMKQQTLHGYHRQVSGGGGGVEDEAGAPNLETLPGDNFNCMRCISLQLNYQDSRE